jgi:hypothetical protein
VLLWVLGSFACFSSQGRLIKVVKIGATKYDFWSRSWDFNSQYNLRIKAIT